MLVETKSSVIFHCPRPQGEDQFGKFQFKNVSRYGPLFETNTDTTKIVLCL